jgi:Tol biopolymer transport system component
MAQRFDPDRLQLSGEPQPVADPVGGIPTAGQMTLAASPAGVLFYSLAASNRQLTWLDKEGKRLGTLGEPGAYFNVGLSPDGRRAVVTRASITGGDLWMVEIGRGAWSRFTFTPGFNDFPVWSPDGRTVVFRSGSPFNLYRKEATGAGTEQRITESTNTQIPSDWSRDGRLLLFYEIAPETQRDVWVLPVTAAGKPEEGAQPRPYLRSRFNEWEARFSPEPHPRWVAYVSDESGQDEVYIQAFPEPRGKWPISTGGGRQPRWSPDGRELFYVAPDNKVMAVGLKLGPDSVEVSALRGMFTGPGDIFASSPYDVAPDGQRFLVRAVPETGSQPLQVIVNWPALLKKGTAE